MLEKALPWRTRRQFHGNEQDPRFWFEGLGYRKIARSVGKKILITGGNSGIGLCAAKDLAKAGADIIITSRTRAKAEAAVSEINTEGKGSADFVLLNLADLGNVRECALGIQERLPGLDALVSNAGTTRQQ